MEKSGDEIFEPVVEAIEDVGRKLTGYIGWLAIAGTVLAGDTLLDDTITNAYRNGLKNPVTRPLVVAGTLYTLAHLTGILPHKFDAFDAIGDGLNWIGERLGREA